MLPDLERMTPEQAARASASKVKSELTSVDAWLAKASVPELLQYIHWLDPREAEHCFERARAELDARLANQVAMHTETLVSESKKLGWLTWGLFLLTAALLAYTFRLFALEKDKESQKIQVVATPVMVTNVPIYIVVTNVAITPD
jgi:hypothetical protein